MISHLAWLSARTLGDYGEFVSTSPLHSLLHDYTSGWTEPPRCQALRLQLSPVRWMRGVVQSTVPVELFLI